MRRVCLCFLVAFILPLACDDRSDLDLRTWGRPIVNGAPDTDPAHMATVALTNELGTDFFCSGTLITSTVVLTAGHCLWGVSGNIQVFFGNDVSGAGEYREVIEDQVHPDFKIQSVEADIALLRLATPAPGTITSIPHLPASQGLSSADEGVTSVDFSGFGVDEHNNSGIKLHVSDIIDIVCDNPNGCNWVNNRAFGYDQQPGGPCSGDSGGPAFVLRNSTEYVAGITSYGDQQCSRYGVSTTVDRFEPFINSFITPEICDNQIDDDTDGLTDCNDRECSLDPSCPDACEAAETIACGGQAPGTTEGGAWVFTTYGCMQPGSKETGPEVAFRVDAPEGTQVTADLYPAAGGDLDFFLVPADAGGSCDPAGCLDGSFEYKQPEHLVFTVPTGGVYLVVDTWDNPTGFDVQIQCGSVIEVCDNGQDDDADGDIDCDDADCSLSPVCLPDACEAAEVISCGDQEDGDTADGIMEFERYSCLRQGREAGPEVAYQLDVPAGTGIIVTLLHAPGSDLDLFLVPAAGDSCDPDDCLDASLEYGQPESLEFVMPEGGAYLVVETYDRATTYELSVACEIRVENCNNGQDDDSDGDTDCDDADCADEPICMPEGDCGNSTDDDLDGDTDCDDSDCADDPVCLPEGDCDNSQDDDMDGDTDCDDADCAEDPVCIPVEDCDNSVDDDSDGDTDCDDADCVYAAACKVVEEVCVNEVDDDGDGDVDCDDEDCKEHQNCEGVEYGCGCGYGGSGSFGGLIVIGVLFFTVRTRTRNY